MEVAVVFMLTAPSRPMCQRPGVQVVLQKVKGPSGAGSEGRSLGLWFEGTFGTPVPSSFLLCLLSGSEKTLLCVLLHSFMAMPAHPLFKSIIKLSHEQKKPCSL